MCRMEWIVYEKDGDGGIDKNGINSKWERWR